MWRYLICLSGIVRKHTCHVNVPSILPIGNSPSLSPCSTTDLCNDAYSKSGRYVHTVCVCKFMYDLNDQAVFTSLMMMYTLAAVRHSSALFTSATVMLLITARYRTSDRRSGKLYLYGATQGIACESTINHNNIPDLITRCYLIIAFL
jgi:methyl coenzyme M reductase subunit C